MLKTCTKCGISKPVTEFFNHAQTADRKDPRCKQCCYERTKKWQESNSELSAQYTRNWRKRNPDHNIRDNEARRLRYAKAADKIRDQNKSYYRRAKHKFLAKNTRRRKCIKLQTPKWADRNAIDTFYANCPAGFHVDHIVPLKGKNVCGLHVESNLQYLRATENLVKGIKN